MACFVGEPVDPAGTPEFIPPEVIDDPEKVETKGVNGSVDIWAVGILAFFLLCGETPFEVSLC